MGHDWENPRTGAEAYFAAQMTNPRFARAYRRNARQIARLNRRDARGGVWAEAMGAIHRLWSAWWHRR